MTAKQQAGKWSMEQVCDFVGKAVNKLRKEPLLFSNHANERSITHRLAIHMEPLFEGWNIDCEYNRIGTEANKYKQFFIQPEDIGHVSEIDPEGSRVFPDIVVHHRGENGSEDNLLIVEVKLKWAKSSAERDFLKLAAFTGLSKAEQLVSYRFGLFLMFDESGEVVHEMKFERPKN